MPNLTKLPGTFSVFVLRVLWSQKPLHPGQTGTTGHPDSYLHFTDEKVEAAKLLCQSHRAGLRPRSDELNGVFLWTGASLTHAIVS